MIPTQDTKGYVNLHFKTLVRRRVGHILDNIFTFNQTEDRNAGNKALVKAILTEKIVSDWEACGITYAEPFVKSTRNRLDINFNIRHPQKGILVFAINRGWDGTGRITISSRSGLEGYNLPKDAEKAISKLQEIIIGATTTH